MQQGATASLNLTSDCPVVEKRVLFKVIQSALLFDLSAGANIGAPTSGSAQACKSVGRGVVSACLRSAEDNPNPVVYGSGQAIQFRSLQDGLAEIDSKRYMPQM